MTTVAYSDIPQDAITCIEHIIKDDEGGWVLTCNQNDPDGGWTYAGVTRITFEQYTGQRASIEAMKDVCDSEEVQHSILEIYYNNYYLPLFTLLKEHCQQELALYESELSCAINCGVQTAFGLIAEAGSTRMKSSDDFLDAWEDHYIKLAVDNAAAWRNFAVAIINAAHPQPEEPTTFRAPNLQGWINRVRKYRNEE